MLFKDTAEVSLIMISAYFTDLTDGQRRIINKQLLCFVHSKIGQIFGWGVSYAWQKILVRYPGL